jgi:hypothetical protein
MFFLTEGGRRLDPDELRPADGDPPVHHGSERQGIDDHEPDRRASADQVGQAGIGDAYIRVILLKARSRSVWDATPER